MDELGGGLHTKVIWLVWKSYGLCSCTLACWHNVPWDASQRTDNLLIDNGTIVMS